MNFNAQGGDVFLFKFTCEMALDEGGLSGSTITNKHELEGWSWLLSHD